MPSKVEDKVSLINDPRNDYGKLYTVHMLGNVVGGSPVRYVNQPADMLKAVARATLEGGEPVWFGCDVGKRFHQDLAVMDVDLYDYTLVLGTGPGMTKAERLRFKESLMTHAMVFTGVYV